MNRTIALVTAAVALGAMSATAVAQKPPATKKLYCWNENGRKVCGDTLPPNAVDSARTELSASSGRPLGEVGRALTPEERVLARQAEQAELAAANADAARKRRELAMVESYETEHDLRSAFNDRIVLVEEGLKTSRMSVGNLRASLLSLLRQANDLELQGRPVPRPLAGNIRAQHHDLLRQQGIMRQQLDERASLGDELEQALERYRVLKAPPQRG